MNAPPPQQFFLDAQLDMARAIQGADLASVRALAPRAELNTPGAHDMTLLAFAMMAASDLDAPHLAVLTELVRLGADPHQEIPHIGTVWGGALNAATPHYAKALLDGGVDPNYKLKGHTPSLFRASSETTVETMRLLIERGADVNARDTVGTPAITFVLRTMQLDQVDELLDRGADPSAVNLLGQSFLFVLTQLMERAQPGSAALAKMESIRNRVLATGKLKWPPDSPRAEREIMREQGVEPIVPAGESR